MIDEKEIQQKINNLVNLLNQWNLEYFVLNSPSVSDLEYDKKLLELEKLEAQFPHLIRSDSPTQQVGIFNDKRFTKVIHQKPMLSLAKAYNYDEIIKFVNNIKKFVPFEDINFSIEPKIDGLSISLHYENGYLKRAITRGDGIEGEDVSHNVLMINSIPQVIDLKENIEIRGEVYLSKSMFKKINEFNKLHNLKEFANPRNAASGTLRQLDSSIVKARNLSAFLYEIVNFEKYNLKTQSEVLNYLKKLNFPVTEYHKIAEIDDLAEIIENFAEIKNSFDYDIDGLVIKLNDLTYWKDLGTTAKFPRAAIAFKYDVEQSITKVLNIQTTVGRTGKITYIANLEAIELNQTIVKNATLHNYDFIQKLNLNLGDEVVIIKAGEIIPKVLDNYAKHSTGVYPKSLFCPSCHSPLIQYGDLVDQYCSNLTNCPEVIINSIVHFAMRKSLNIVGLGINTVKDLFKANLVHKIEDIFELYKHKETLLALPRYAEQKVQNLLDAIEQAKNSSFDKVLFALGIKNLGERAAKLIGKICNSFAELQMESNLEKISNLDNIGPIIVQNLHNFINSEQNQNLMSYLDQNFAYIQKSKNNFISDKLNNLTFVITGKLSQNREYFSNLIELHGGNVSSSISKKTDYLLAGIDAGSKLDKAKKLNVKIINEIELLELVN